MKRLALVPVVALALGVVACSGGTDPATSITNLSAQLNAHGHTTGEPATWWWEYAKNQSDLGTANDTEVCGVGAGPKEPDNRCGPASYGTGDVPLSVVVGGLTPNTTYYFRVCGQDQSWSQGACGSVKSFTTLSGTSYAFDRTWGNSGTANGWFNTPTGIALDSSANVYVADSGNHRVQKFNSTGTFLAKWGSLGSGNGQFNFPTGVSVDLAGNVYVTDLRNNRVERFDSTGAFLTKWGSFGSGDGQFDRPQGIAASREFIGGHFFTRIYVADTGGNHRIQKFDPAGGFLTKWGGSGSGDGQFNTPYGAGADPATGNLYVGDTFNNRIQRFSPAGAFLGKWGSFGSGDGQFDQPNGVAVDSVGDVYVADQFHDRVQKFSSTGGFITKWGQFGSDDGAFWSPAGVAIDRYGYVYVTDTNNHRIQRFKPVQ